MRTPDSHPAPPRGGPATRPQQHPGCCRLRPVGRAIVEQAAKGEPQTARAMLKAEQRDELPEGEALARRRYFSQQSCALPMIASWSPLGAAHRGAPAALARGQAAATARRAGIRQCRQEGASGVARPGPHAGPAWPNLRRGHGRQPVRLRPLLRHRGGPRQSAASGAGVGRRGPVAQPGPRRHLVATDRPTAHADRRRHCTGAVSGLHRLCRHW